VEEKDDEILKEKIETVLEEIGERPRVRDCCRVGIKKTAAKTLRPINISLPNSDQVNHVLRSAL
jgi:hypothetical protein